MICRAGCRSRYVLLDTTTSILDDADEEGDGANLHESSVGGAAATGEKKEGEANSEELEKVQLDMPPSWVERLHIERDDYQVCSTTFTLVPPPG